MQAYRDASNRNAIGMLTGVSFVVTQKRDKKEGSIHQQQNGYIVVYS